MWIDAARGGIETGIRGSINADTAVVAWNVREQPRDRVVCVRRFVDVGLAFGHVLVRRHLRERAFGLEPATRILIHEDEARLSELRIAAGPERPAIRVRSVWRDTVRRPLQENRRWL